MSSTDIKALLKSPYEFWWNRNFPLTRKSTQSLEDGRLIHIAILEPERFREIIRKPTFTGKGSKGKKEEFQEMVKEKNLTVIDDKQAFMIHNIMFSLSQPLHKKEADLLYNKAGIREHSYFMTDSLGLKCKARPDLFLIKRYKNTQFGIIVDLKSCTNAKKSNFKRDIEKWRYDIQAQFYIETLKPFYPDVTKWEFIFVAIEKKIPYNIASYTLDQSLLKQASEDIERAKACYIRCNESGIWPGIDEHFSKIEQLYIEGS